MRDGESPEAVSGSDSSARGGCDEPFSVSVVALPEASACAMYSAMDDFGAVGRIGESVVFGEPATAPPFRTQIVSTTSEPLVCQGHITVTPHAAVTRVESTDIVFVPALFAFEKLQPHHAGPRFDPVLIDWIATMYARGAVVCSVCTGAFVLAESGILDGWCATTHWYYGDLMKSCFPRVDVQARRPIVISGPDDRIVTGGTGTYFTDLTLYLIQRFAGPERTHRFAKLLGKFWRGDEHDLFARSLESHNYTDATIRRAQEWIAEHLDARNPVKEAASRVHLTERTFTRRFRRATGQTPLDYVHDLRVEQARNLLERVRLPVDEVAERVGYTDVSHFRRLFKRKVGIPPGEYRRRFKLPPPTGAAHPHRQDPPESREDLLRPRRPGGTHR